MIPLALVVIGGPIILPEPLDLLRRQMLGLLERRPRGGADVDPEFARDEFGQRRLSKPRRAEEDRS